MMDWFMTGKESTFVLRFKVVSSCKDADWTLRSRQPRALNFLKIIKNLHTPPKLAWAQFLAQTHCQPAQD